MPKKKTLELVETQSLSSVLIIGVDQIAADLSSNLKEHGCVVTLSDSYLITLGRFDYIFQFGNFSLVDSAVKNHLLPLGKFLFIETTPEPNLSKKEQLRIIRIGDPMCWKKEELIDKILRAMFLTKSSSIIDVRKKSYFVPKTTATKKPVFVPLPLKDSFKEHPVEPAKKARIINKSRVIAFSLILFLGLLPCIGVYWYGLSLKQTVSSFRTHLASSNWQALTSDVKTAKQQLQPLKNVYNFSSYLFFFLSNTRVFQDTGSMLAASDNFLVSAEDFLSFSKEILRRKTSFFSTGKGITKNELLLLKNKVNSLYVSIATAKKRLDEVSTPFFPKESFTPLLSSASDKLLAVEQTLPLVEKMFFDQPKVYLVLFQNSMELRPTGGFIGSFALLTADNGQILDFKIEDVYTADGQLKGHVDPPLPIRKYLSLPHFFLRDSNFDPDYAVSAVKAAWFLEKELGKKVDGVVAVNLPFAQRLLRIVGSLTLTDFNNEEVSSDNFFVKAHLFTKQNFFPGSTQKKDFFTSVANALIQKLTFEKEIPWLDLFAVVRQSLEEKNILIYFLDENLQKFIEEQGWGGRMVKTQCVGSQKNCLSDYLSIIEANLGVNKANYFVSKSVTVEKKILADGKITSIVILAYENAADSEIFPESTYVNYLRIFVPVESKLLGVTLNNTPLAVSDIDMESYSTDKTTFGFLVKTAPENKAVVKITYILPHSISSETSSYQFFFQKQAGDKNSPLVISVTSPPELKLKPVNFKSTSGREQEIFYITDTSVDRIFAFETIY